MRRTSISFVIALVLIVATALGAGAGGFHFKSASFTSGSLTFSGVGVGLGNTAYTAVLSATATVRAQCTNKGGTKADGRNDLFASVEGDAMDGSTDDRGQTTLSLTVENPGLPDLDAPPNTKQDCPNGNWQITGLGVVEWTSAHLLLTATNDGSILFEQDYVCSGGGTKTDSVGNVLPLNCVEA